MSASNHQGFKVGDVVLIENEEEATIVEIGNHLVIVKFNDGSGDKATYENVHTDKWVDQEAYCGWEMTIRVMRDDELRGAAGYRQRGMTL